MARTPRSTWSRPSEPAGQEAAAPNATCGLRSGAGPRAAGRAVAELVQSAAARADGPGAAVDAALEHDPATVRGVPGPVGVDLPAEQQMPAGAVGPDDPQPARRRACLRPLDAGLAE